MVSMGAAERHITREHALSTLAILKMWNIVNGKTFFVKETSPDPDRYESDNK